LERTDCNLSPHEARVLSLLVDGHNLKTAATELDITRATVAWHMRNIYEKPQVHSKSGAVAKALRAGLISRVTFRLY
jgi:DNA-binding CsgD family transcriptional regulator